MKLFFSWIFYGIFIHYSFAQYKHTKTFVGPRPKSLYEEMMEDIDRMKARIESFRHENEKIDKFIAQSRARSAARQKL